MGKYLEQNKFARKCLEKKTRINGYKLFKTEKGPIQPNLKEKKITQLTVKATFK